jgi:hypothetical protein
MDFSIPLTYLNLQQASSEFELKIFTSLERFEVKNAVDPQPLKKYSSIQFLGRNKTRGTSLIPKESVNAMGNMEYHHFLKSPFIAYSRIRTSASNLNKNAANKEQVLDFVLYSWAAIEIELLLLALWCINDHCCNAGVCFLIETGPNSSVVTHSHPAARRSYKADGSISGITKWEKDEVEQAYSMKKMISSFLSAYIPHSEQIPLHTTVHRKEVDRCGRFFYLLANSIRQEPDLASRIAFSIQGLEMLIGTSTSELASSLSLGWAVILGKDETEKQDIFDLVKKCYSIRSKVLHGDVFKLGQVEELEKNSIKLDQLLRRIVAKILSDESFRELLSKNKEELGQTLSRAIIKGHLS